MNVPIKKCWYALVEVLSDNDQNREQCIVKVDRLKKFKVEEFLKDRKSVV